MKTRIFVSLLILVLAVLIVIGGCATRRKAIAEDDFFESWSGTWVNTDLKAEQKRINYPDGTWERYSMVTSTTVGCHVKSTMTDMWIESKGTIWYKCRWKCLTHDTIGYEMGKIDDSGNTLEYIRFGGDYPIEKWEPDNSLYTYRIYYRQ